MGFLHKAPWNVVSVKLMANLSDIKWPRKQGREAYDRKRIRECSTRYPYLHDHLYDHAEIRSYSDHDMLEWNVTGNGWNFEIDSATCEVELPVGVHIQGNKCSTGPVGSTDSNCTGYAGKEGIYSFHTTKGLVKNEGLSISLDFDKGVMTEPSFTDKLSEFCASNMVFVIAAIAFLLYCFILWFMSNIYSSSNSLVIPEFAPPPGMSPAEVGFVDSREYSSNLLVSEIVYAAVNKAVSLTVTNNDDSITFQVDSLGNGSVVGDTFISSIVNACPMQINKQLKVPSSIR